MTKKSCQVCNKSFRSRKTRTKFCSRRCSGISQRAQVSKTCKICSQPFTVNPARKDRAKFCSYPCYYISKKAKSPTERFWAKVKKGKDNDCWLWQGGIAPNGYGKFWADSKNNRDARVHRFSWEISNGPIPSGLYVLHHCDVRRCVNPAHLFLGTHSDNMQDMLQKGRAGWQK